MEQERELQEVFLTCENVSYSLVGGCNCSGSLWWMHVWGQSLDLHPSKVDGENPHCCLCSIMLTGGGFCFLEAVLLKLKGW